MFEFGREPGRAIVVCKAPAVVRLRHLDEVIELEKLIAEVRPMGLLLDWSQLEGWDEESESARFLVRLELRKHLQRVAVLGESRWEPEVGRLQEVTGVPVRHFHPSERQAALDWLDANAA